MKKSWMAIDVDGQQTTITEMNLCARYNFYRDRKHNFCVTAGENSVPIDCKLVEDCITESEKR